jgi:hypothetical protein
MRKRNITFQWIEGKADGVIGQITSIAVDNERRMIRVCYDAPHHGSQYEGASPQEEDSLTSEDI